MNKKILVIGHPRCGTLYTSEFLKTLDLDILHEKMGKDGTSNWQFTINDYPIINENKFKRSDFKWDNIIVTMRNPFDAINSIANTETPLNRYEYNNEQDYYNGKQITNEIVNLIENGMNKEDATSYIIKNYKIGISSLIRRKIIYIDIKGSNILRASQSYINWYKYIEKNIDYNIIFRIEKDQQILKNYLYEKKIIDHNNYIKKPNLPKNINGREYDKLTKDEWNSLPNNILIELNNFCKKYEYDNIYKQIEDNIYD